MTKRIPQKQSIAQAILEKRLETQIVREVEADHKSKKQGSKVPDPVVNELMIHRIMAALTSAE